MRLLVSVQSAEEAVDAWAGGAEIIDAKDPAGGALGVVSLGGFREIRAAVPRHHLVTAALGDADDAAAIEQLACEYASSGAGLVKVGFARIADVGRIAQLLAACVQGCARGNAESGVVAVAYADEIPGASVDPTALLSIAAHAGARGVLVDTADKHGVGLTALWTPVELSSWIARAHDHALLVAVAGKLGVDDLDVVRDAGADVAGLRGAACIGGRTGRVSIDRVRDLVVSHRFSGARSVAERR